MNNNEYMTLLKESMNKQPTLPSDKLKKEQKKAYQKIEEDEMKAYLHGEQIEHYESDQTKMLKWPADEFPKADSSDAKIDTQQEIKLDPSKNTKV